jgi:hypothetical protein
VARAAPGRRRGSRSQNEPSPSLRFGSAIDIEDESFADERCEQPPLGHEERWCEVNAGACEQGGSDRCSFRTCPETTMRA